MKFRFTDNRIARETSVEDLLSYVIEDYKIYTEFAVEDLKRSWIDIVGPILVNHTKVESIFKNTLFVTADHSIYSQEVLMCKTAIINKINELFGNNSVKTVKVNLKKFT